MICFPETISFKVTPRDRERLETLCLQLEQTSGEVLRQLLREKAAQVLAAVQGTGAADGDGSTGTERGVA